MPVYYLLMANLDDFKKLDIRIGKIISAEKIEGSDKLLKLIFDFGSESGLTALTTSRQIIAGIATSYPDCEKLVGKEMPVIVNLEPRVLRGNESQGMILAAVYKDKVTVIIPQEDIEIGAKIQ